MDLYDEEKMKNKNQKENKINRVLVSLIIITVVIIIALMMGIYYLINNPSKTIVKLDGKENSSIEKIIEIKENGNDSITINAPIKDFAKLVGYNAFNGEYLSASQDENICNVQSENDVTIFYLDSSKVYKKDLTDEISEFESYDTGALVYEKDGVLYTNDTGLEIGFNLSFSYNIKKKILNISSLDTKVEEAKTLVKDKYKIPAIDESYFSNKRAILDGIAITTSEEIIEGSSNENIKYGAIDLSTGKSILEMKYDKIKYLPNKLSFLVSMNGKVGIIDSQGKETIQAIYDDLKLIDKESELYMAKRDDLYGVIDNKGNIVIYLEYSQIGVDINNFNNNGLKTGYILLNELIPVKQANKWGFFDKSGKKITDIIYDDIGCSINNSESALYNLLIIPNYNLVVVKRDKGYTFIDLKGKEQLSNVIENTYIKLNSGEPIYYMIIDKKEYNVINALEQRDKGE